jgi:non-specific serine/threonine protein kinase
VEAATDGGEPELRPVSLPVPTTSFVGRDREVTEVGGLVGRRRIVTLVGSGGCGKTRLALETARQLPNDHGGEAWFVDLSVITDGGLVPDTIARSLGIGGTAEPAERALIRWLADQTALIVLDNCEHVLASAASAAELLVRHCPSLRILATSRERLRIGDEWVYHIRPLAIPTSRPATADIGQVESVRLFRDRATQADSSFELSEHNLSAVAGVCTTLDGIPLAIELAASCIGSMSPQLILERLEDRFSLLQMGPVTAPPRHRTLRAAVEWSHSLLSEAERRLFRRLSVFVGSFDVDAVEKVVTDSDLPPSTALPLLQSLVDRSLVAFSPEGPSGRYRLLETLRAFAYERLGVQEGADRFQARHAAYFLEIADRWFDGFWWIHPYVEPSRQDVDNFLAALEYGRHSAAPAVGHIASVIHWLRWQGLLNAESASWWWTETLAQCGPSDPYALTSLHYGLGKTASRRGQQQLARSQFELLLGLCEQAGDSHGVVRALLELSAAAGSQGDGGAAIRIGNRAVALAREFQRPGLLAYALDALAMALLRESESGTALRAAEEALSLARQVGEPHLVGNVLDTVALAYLHLGEVGIALELQREALQDDRRSSWETAAWLYTMAALLGAAGQSEHCLHLGGAIDAWFERQGNERDPGLAIYRPWIDAAATALGSRAAAVRASGRRLSIEEAWAYALDACLVAKRLVRYDKAEAADERTHDQHSLA